MNRYRIEINAISDVYEGESEEEALNRYAEDAGYKNFEELQKQHPAEVSIIRI